MPTEKLIFESKPSKKQKEFFSCHSKFVAYGGARGGGKSWALRRKLVALCLKYSKLKCLLVRRTYAEIKANHLFAFLTEYGKVLSYNEARKVLTFKNGSEILLGYCANDKDLLRYQGQEYDIIAIDEATQFSEMQFRILSATLRGVNNYPKRMYLTCNPGGIGHAWMKRLFVDKIYHENEQAKDYSFVSALVYDNPVLLNSSPDYVKMLESLPQKLKEAWLYGKWNVFEGQFFPEFSETSHLIKREEIPGNLRYFMALDYGFDMTACLLLGVDAKGKIYVLEEAMQENLTLSEAGNLVLSLVKDRKIDYLVASPDLWNRRQDTGLSGFEILSSFSSFPPLLKADNRRIAGWRLLRDYLAMRDGASLLVISENCKFLIQSLQNLLCDDKNMEDASSRPHEFTHAPEALRYGIMSRPSPFSLPLERDKNFTFLSHKKGFYQ